MVSICLCLVCEVNIAGVGGPCSELSIFQNLAVDIQVNELAHLYAKTTAKTPVGFLSPLIGT